MNSLRFITVAISLALVSISCSKTGTQSKTSTAVEVPFSVTPGSLVFTKDAYGTETQVRGVTGTLSIDGLQELKIPSYANATYYIRLSVRQGQGLDYPPAKMHCAAQVTAKCR